MAKFHINKQAIKDYTLKAYIILTFLALYSAAMFYAGAQFNAHADNVMHVKAAHPSK